MGASYEGIDVQAEYFGRKTVATRLENLAELSYPDAQFDRVIGNQTMEHWGEHGCSLRWGLYQCFRVLKESGELWLNVPIHFHGTSEFMLGRLDRIRELLRPFSNTVTLEKWGTPSDPLPLSFPYPGYWTLRRHPAYVLDIRAVKDRPLPDGYSNRGAASGRLAQMLYYPISYNVFRVLKKVGLIRPKRVARDRAGA